MRTTYSDPKWHVLPNQRWFANTFKRSWPTKPPPNLNFFRIYELVLMVARIFTLFSTSFLQNIYTSISGSPLPYLLLTHWGRVTHICVSNLTIIGSDNGLSPGRRQAIIWTNAGISLIQTLGTNFNEILRGIYTFSFKKMHLKMSSRKRRPSCLGLNVLNFVNISELRAD